jgi:suppressor for copper-sensitivity B
LIRFVTALILALFAADPSHAEGVRLSLVDAGYGRSGSQLLLGLKVDLDEGWHSYWQSPGETGLPSSIEADDRSNAGAADVLWPLPERFDVSGYETVGYRSSFVVPFTVPVDDKGAPASFHLKGTIYACSDVCVPFPVDLSSQTAPGFRDPSALAEIAPWLVRVPRAEKGALKVLRSSVEGEKLTVEFSSPDMSTPSAFVDLGTRAFASLSSMKVAGGVATAEFSITATRGKTVDPSGAPLVVSDGRNAYRTTVAATALPSLGTLSAALLGGLLLNVMPCVFPVLAIKVFSLAAAPVSRRRLSYGATAAGIVCAFLSMAGVVALLKAAGQETAWGMQFQQPVFLVVMTMLTALFAANLAGAFEIVLPSRVATRLHALTGGEGAAAAFGQGFVLTLLATPCSAPFVGAAVGFALSGGMSAVFPVFAAMGFGMALPYVLLASVPAATRLLPRPGRWMSTAKYVLAAAMAVSSGWLASLLAPAGPAWLAVICSLAVLAGLLMIWRGVPKAAAAACVAAFLIVPLAQSAPMATDRDGVAWRAFEPARIDAMVREGKSVFVDVSADWCLTCKVNEKGALATQEVRAILADPKIVPMKGDWTRPDEEIGLFLKSHGRYGIPFYLVVGPSAPQGILLPELLSIEAVRDAVKRAGRSGS